MTVSNISINIPTTEITSTQRDSEHGVLTFQLCRKDVYLAGHCLDQWWFSQRTLYGERNRHSPNHRSIVDCFWQLCGEEGTQDHRDIRECYILAYLLPHARSNGSRRVFVDSRLRNDSRSEETDRTTIVQELELMLAADRSSERTVPEFYSRTGEVLGPPEYSEDVWECYRQLCNDILIQSHEAWQAGGNTALHSAMNEWADRNRKIGRRAGNNLAKDALDILSYECRTSFIQAYSAVWMNVLLEWLPSHYHFSPESILFHRLWHMDQVCESNETPFVRFHLFHGHIFSLHPAFGNLLSTRTGCDLVGELISDPTDIGKHHRFLNAALIAIHQYASRYDVIRELRRGMVTQQSRDNELPDVDTSSSSRPRRRPRRLY